MLHIIKLCVGVTDPAELRAWQAERLGAGLPLRHLTRNMPRRAAEIVGVGSLYWVVNGTVLLRQRLAAIQPAVRHDGAPCAALVLDPVLVAVRGRPVKAFQGWRYLRAEDAPDDAASTDPDAAMPHAMAQELRTLGLL